MRGLKVVSVVLAFAAASSLVFGVAGFSAISGDRGIDVSVVPDAEAYVGYNATDHDVEDGEEITLVTVENRLPMPPEATLDVSVQAIEIVAGDEIGFENVTTPHSLAPGETGEITATVNCTGGANATVAVTVNATGDGVATTLNGTTRTFEVRC